MTTARSLALRDSALCALLGVSVGAPGADFGSENPSFGGSFGAQFGLDAIPGVGMMSTGPASAVPAHLTAPTPANMQAAWGHYQGALEKQAHSNRRAAILDPNAGSDIQIERYFFSINQTLTLGTSVAVSASGNPDTKMRPQRVTVNAPSCGFGTIDELKVSNVSVSIGGTCDMFDFNAAGVTQELDMPTLTPSNKASCLGNYTGFVAPGFVNGATYKLCISFKGPSVVAGG